MSARWLLYYAQGTAPPPGPAQVLAVLTPGDSRSQTTDPLTQSDTGTPGTVAGPYADSAWDLDGSSQVRFDTDEIGADNARGALAFWFRRASGSGTVDLAVLGELGSTGASIYPYYVNASGTFWFEFYAPNGDYLADLSINRPVSVGEAVFVYVEWDGAAVRARIDGGTFATGSRGVGTAGGFDGDVLSLGLPIGATRATIIGPAMLADGPLADEDVDCLYERSTSWDLDMGTAGWCGVADTTIDATTVPVSLPSTSATIASGADVLATTVPVALPATSATIASGADILATTVPLVLAPTEATIASGADILATTVPLPLAPTSATIAAGADILATAVAVTLPATSATITVVNPVAPGSLIGRVQILTGLSAVVRVRPALSAVVEVEP